MFIRRSVNFIKFAYFSFFMILFSINIIYSQKSSNISRLNQSSNTIKEKNFNNTSIFELNRLKFTLGDGKFNSILENFKFIEFTNDDRISPIFLEKSNNRINKVLQKGWLRYMEINEDSKIPPSNFFTNANFFTQKTINQKSKIPGKNFFFFELTSETLTIFNDSSSIRRKIEEVKIDKIGENPNLNPCKGGIEKIGHFAEGYCFIIKFRKNSKKALWELCSDKESTANKWIQSLILVQEENKFKSRNLKGNLYRDVLSKGNSKKNNLEVFQVFPKSLSTTDKISQISSDKGINRQIIISRLFWQPKGGWSSCSKTCGGGIQTRTYVCKKVGKCNGEAIKKRQCNLQKCKEDLDKQISNLEKVAKGKWEYLGNWSPCSQKCGLGGYQKIKRICVNGNCLGNTEVSRPCNIKECSEKFRNNKNKKGKSKNIFEKCKNLIGEFNLLNGDEIIPTVVEVNMKNIEFYRFENFQHAIIKENMKPYMIISNSEMINFSQSKRNENCIKLQSDNVNLKKNSAKILIEKSPKIRLCNKHIVKKVGNDQISKGNFCVEWMKRFEEFKKKCSKQILEKTLKEIEKSISTKITTNSLINKIAKKIQVKKGASGKKKEKLLDLKFSEFKKQADQILKKEESYEKNLIEQEKNRLECEDKKFNEEIKKQENMTKKIMNEIKNEKKKTVNYTLKEKIVKREMKNILNKIDSQISEQRLKMLGNLQKLRTGHNVTRKKAVSKLLNLKKNLGKELSKINGGKGDPKKCFSEKSKILVYRKEYCFKNFSSNKILIENCIKESQFCYTCCDSEMQLETKDNLKCCYNKCDSVSNSNKQCNVFYNSFHIIMNPLRGINLFD